MRPVDIIFNSLKNPTDKDRETLERLEKNFNQAWDKHMRKDMIGALIVFATNCVILLSLAYFLLPPLS